MDKDFETWLDETMVLLGAIQENDCQPHSIAIVPEELGKWSKKEYEPKVVSIGPRFKGRKKLLPMEEIKLRCMLHLSKRTGRDSLEEKLKSCMRFIFRLDAAVRTSYGDQIDLDSYGLATIMLHDACFLLELFISQSVEWNSKLQPHNDTLPPSPAAQLGNIELILSDLTLLENQIPFFVLFHVFAIFFPHLVPNDNPFLWKIYLSITQDLALSLFGYSRDSSSTSIPDPIDASHILQLIHSFILNPQSHHGSCVIDIEVNVNKQIEPKFCATRLLAAAGVTIVKTEDNSIIPKFSSRNGVLEVPPLHITQTMEATWRNFIAWELHTTRWKKSVGRDLFTVRALLYNDLICCASDVQLLKNKGIIVDELGMSNHHLMDLLRSITNGVDRALVDSTYWNMIHALNTYNATNCVIGFPIIVWHYLSRFSEWLYGLNKFLRRGYNFAAALITLLTAIQTCYAILSYHYPKKN
ncbi:UPF0481 protein At3g47200 [Cajanus cajan]|nr:UPF0481 protein At3g47200 [Cajanus cajan]XP_029126029.1 UPF0481 protein At3g47200 [Cajanus cajan]